MVTLIVQAAGLVAVAAGFGVVWRLVPSFGRAG